MGEFIGHSLEYLMDVHPIFKIGLGLYFIHKGFTDEDMYENIEAKEWYKQFNGKITRFVVMGGGGFLILQSCFQWLE